MIFNKSTYIRIFLFIIILLILKYLRNIDEGLSENFLNNKKYYYCSDQRGPGTYYRIVNKEIETPLRGFYSDLINIMDDKYLDKNTRFFKTPICKKIENYEKDYFNDNKIIDIEYNDFISEIDPFDPFDKPENQNTSIYDEEINKNILKESKELETYNLLRIQSNQ